MDYIRNSVKNNNFNIADYFMSLSETDRNNANKRFIRLIEEVIEQSNNEKNRFLKAFAKRSDEIISG
jgi:hypothetical protein